ncbi:MAG TPA: MBL fold metallo-hydrolase [Sedimentibacter sp.]|jgi:glyoxylase-like metal-dependent hydrolase (beta-lactamase superfamily II)|nr:MBL fold metallo-hydrolase [Sedimentibacter sp.]HHZ00424.1 MBL fold metallo-hydrolase [Tissierellia bacterium]HOK48755.1 MBL fold metallo-hydrolase [Sedimentibacter sp.]HOW23414.1 MBL fold metallo-hydrolase [Sedimentibacter sp.]HRC81676.1 MBL fold metallo-hydrolase [Sedimentibacter sp.]
MIFEAMEVGIYGANCYIVASEETKEGAIIDPGADFNKIDNKIKELGIVPKMIILTHCHGDHIGAVEDLVNKYGLKVCIHDNDANALSDSRLNFTKSMFRKDISITADVLLKDGDIVNLGDLKLEIIHTPGHTQGGICIKVGNIMMTGDTLFRGSIGRTDFPGGSYEEIIRSIKEKIFKYDEDTVIYPGHMSPSTIKNEKLHNPFVKEA